MAPLTRESGKCCQLCQHFNQICETDEDKENYWFPTPEDPGDPQSDTPIQQTILKEFYNLQKLEKLNPQDNPETRKQILPILTGQILR